MPWEISQPERIFQQEWKTPGALAEQLYIMMRMQRLAAAAAGSDEEGTQEAALPPAARETGAAGALVSVGLGGVARQIVPVVGAGARGVALRRHRPVVQDTAQVRTMPTEAPAARPQRAWVQPEGVTVPEFPASEPARQALPGLAQLAARQGVVLPTLDRGARPAPHPRPAAAAAELPTLELPTRAPSPSLSTAPAQERPGFSPHPQVRAVPTPAPTPAAPDLPGQAGAVAAAVATAVTLPALQAVAVEPVTIAPLPKLELPEMKIAPDDPPLMHAVWIGVVISGSGNKYQVDLYQQGLTGGSGPEVTVNIPEIDSGETIPEGTVLACIHDYGNGYYECQVPIWL